QVWINYIHIMTYDFFLCLFFGKSNDSKGGASISSKTKKRQARGSVIEINLDNMRDKAIFNQPEINDSRRYRMKKQRKHTRVTTPVKFRLRKTSNGWPEDAVSISAGGLSFKKNKKYTIEDEINIDIIHHQIAARPAGSLQAD